MSTEKYYLFTIETSNLPDKDRVAFHREINGYLEGKKQMPSPLYLSKIYKLKNGASFYFVERKSKKIFVSLLNSYKVKYICYGEINLSRRMLAEIKKSHREKSDKYLSYVCGDVSNYKKDIADFIIKQLSETAQYYKSHRKEIYTYKNRKK